MHSQNTESLPLTNRTDKSLRGNIQMLMVDNKWKSHSLKEIEKVHDG